MKYNNNLQQNSSKTEIMERVADPQMHNISIIEGRPLQLECLNILSHPSPTHQWSLVDGGSSQELVVDPVCKLVWG